MLIAEIAVARANRCAGGEIRQRPVGGEAFQPGIDGGMAVMIGAHHGGADEQRGLEQPVAAAFRVDIAIFDIHHRIGADLHFTHHAERRINIVSPGAGARDDGRREVFFGQGGADIAERFGIGDIDFAALFIILDMHDVSGIAL